MSLTEITFVDIPEKLLGCELLEHKGHRVEFVCTKKDCKQRLACSLCILQQHAFHFPWMRVVEDYTEADRQKLELEERIKIREEIENFVLKKEEYLEVFSDKLDNQANNILSKIGQFKKQLNDSFDKIEKSLQQNTDNFIENVFNHYELLRTYFHENPLENEQITIQSIETLLHYIEIKLVELPNDENKIQKIHETLKETFNAIAIIKYSSKKSKDVTNLLSNLISFIMKIDNLLFMKVNHPFISSNFSIDTISCKKTICTIQKSINGILFFHDETMMATYSDDASIYIYNVKNGDLLNTLAGHTDKITTLIKVKDGSLVSSSFDKKIKIWNPFKATCEKTLIGHQNSIYSLMEFPNQILVSGSWDKTISFWDLKEKESSSGQTSGLFKTIKAENQGRIMSMILTTNDELAVTSEYNINIYNLDSEKVIKTLTGHEGLVRDLLIYDNEKNILISSSDDKTVRMWDWQTGSVLMMLNNKSICNKLIKFNNEIFITANEDGNLKFWDNKSLDQIKQLTISKEPITNIVKLLDGTLITCGGDKNIKFWN